MKKIEIQKTAPFKLIATLLIVIFVYFSFDILQNFFAFGMKLDVKLNTIILLFLHNINNLL